MDFFFFIFPPGKSKKSSFLSAFYVLIFPPYSLSLGPFPLRLFFLLVPEVPCTFKLLPMAYRLLPLAYRLLPYALYIRIMSFRMAAAAPRGLDFPPETVTRSMVSVREEIAF